MSKHLRKGDSVVVITGNDRGKTGKILSLEGERVVIEGVNVRKKNLRPTSQNSKGKQIEVERSIHISNVKPFIEGQAVKLRVRTSQNKRELYYLKGKEEVPFRFVKK